MFSFDWLGIHVAEPKHANETNRPQYHETLWDIYQRIMICLVKTTKNSHKVIKCFNYPSIVVADKLSYLLFASDKYLVNPPSKETRNSSPSREMS